MSAQENNGAPSAPTLDDAFAEADEILVKEAATVQFLLRLRALASEEQDFTEAECYALEHALQKGFEPINDDATLYVVSERSLVAYAAAWRERVADRNDIIVEKNRLVRELDVALNGQVGAAQQASLCDLVAQVQRQQPVQILNQPDGMRINFQAPNGERATLYVSTIADAAARGEPTVCDADVAETMLAAIAAYPVAGGLTDDQIRAALLARREEDAP